VQVGHLIVMQVPDETVCHPERFRIHAHQCPRAHKQKRPVSGK
jgi:hypothetical protein